MIILLLMRKFLLTIFVILFLPVSAFAKALKIESLMDFSSENPPRLFVAKLSKGYRLSRELYLEEGTVLSGSVEKFYNARRGRRNASFKFKIMKINHNGVIIDIKAPPVVGKVVGYTPVKKKKIVKMVIFMSAGLVVPGLAPGVSFMDGLITREHGNPVKSAFVQVYKDSVFSYIDKGRDFDVDTGDILIIKIKKKDLKRSEFHPS